MPSGTSAPRIVVTPRAPVVNARELPRAGTEWRQLEPLVTQLFDDRARRERVSRATLAAVPLSIDAIAATPQADSVQHYFFRASKTVPDSRGDVDLDEDGDVDPKGDLRIDVSGFIRRDARLTSLGTNATLTWEQVDDRPAGSGARRSELNPVAIIRAAGNNAWVMRGRAGESTWYALYDVGANGVRMLVKTDPGSC